MSASTSSYSDDDDGLITDINVTPLVDIVLVVLIVFMITVPSMVAIDLMNEREMSVVLPAASEAKPITSRPTELFVNVDATGRYVVAGETKTENELLQLLQQAQADNPGRAAVVIRADKRTVWQYVMNVMNACNKANIRDYRVTAAE